MSLGWIFVIVGILLMLLYSFLIGLIVLIIGLALLAPSLR